MTITSPIVCRDATAYAPQVTATPISSSSVASSTPVTISGINYIDRAYTAGYSQHTLAQYLPAFGVPWVVTSDTPSICTVTGNTVTRLADGFGKIRFTGSNGFSRVDTIEFNAAAQAVKRIWTGVQAGSPSALFSDPLLALTSPTKQLNYYSAGVGSSAGVTVRNPNCWLASLDLSASPVATSYGGAFGTANSGVLLTRRHGFGVSHWGVEQANMGPGSVLTFSGFDGIKHNRTVIARYVHPTLDLLCWLLDFDLPAGVNPLPLAPANHAATGPRAYGLGFQMTQEKNVSIISHDDFWDKSGVSGGPGAWESTFNLKTDPAHRLYGLGNLMQLGRPGDSGGMICGLVAGQVFLISLFRSSTTGVYLPQFKSVLDAMIASVDAAAGISTGYTVEVLNISTPFDVMTLSPMMWLDASDPATLYDATTGGAPVAADGAIARWEDKSGNGKHLTQATLTSRPLRKIGILNSKAVVKFVDSAGVMTHALSVVGDNTVFMVVRSYNAFNGYDFIFAAAAPNVALNVVITDGAGPDGTTWGTYRDTTWTSSGQTLRGGHRIISLLSVGRSGSYSHNGAIINFAGSAFFQDATDRRWLGDAACEVAELLVFPAALSPADRLKVEQYLNAKWACY